MLRISIAGVTILGAPTDSLSRVEGLFVARDGFDGWEDGGGESRREAVPRPGAHGEFDTDVFQGSRPISIDGHTLAESDEKLISLRNQIMGIGADGKLLRITVEHRGQVLWADVRRGPKPTFKDTGVRFGRRHGRFLLQLVAPDPRKYGQVNDFPGGTVAVNRGNFPATPRLLVGAGAGGYTVTGPGGRQVVVGTAPAGAHYIDFASGGLFTSAGVRQLNAITIYQPWTIDPGIPGGAASISGSRSLTQRVTDTFV